MFLPNMFSPARSTVGMQRWISSIRGAIAKSGASVTPETALAVSAVRACVTILAESVAQLPCELYRRDGDRRLRATDHELYDLIHNQPNQKDTSFEWNEQRMGHLGLRGNSYTLIDWDGRGRIRELIPVNPDKIAVLKGDDGLPYYRLLEQQETLPMRMVHHVKAFSVDGYVGQSPIQTSPDPIGLAIATDEHASRVFSNGTTLSGVITTPNTPFKEQSKIDNFLAKFVERHSGVRNSFNVAMLQDGMDYKQLSMNNEQAQLLDSRKYSTIEICRLFKIPPHMIGEMDKASYNSIEQMGMQFVIYTLLPWLKRIEAAMMRDLLLPKERADLYIEFNVSGMLRGDMKSRYESYAMGRQWGWLSVNDIRRLENMLPIDGGDIYLQPLNMVNAGDFAKGSWPSPKQVKEIEEILCR